MRQKLRHRFCLLLVIVVIIYVLIGYWYIGSHRSNVSSRSKGITHACPPGWKQIDLKCYKLFYQVAALSYGEVITGCHESKAWPVVVSTPQINALIHELMNEYGTDYGPVLIGLTYSTEKQMFQWHDGTKFDFTDWAKNEPNNFLYEKCVEIYDRSKKWNNIPCQSTAKRYACEMFAPRVEKDTVQGATRAQVPDKKPQPGVFTDEMFEKALVSGHRKDRKDFMTIGIPTVHRTNSPWYLEETFASLIQHSTEADKQDMTIVIYLADLNVNQRRALNKKILEYYQKYFDSGFIHTIEAPGSFYPSVQHLKRTHHYPPTKIKWRAKQNFDYAYLMHYSKNISFVTM